MPSIARLVFVAALLTTFSLPSVARAATPDDPCSAIPKSAVERALGTKIVRVVPRPSGPARSCAWRSARFTSYAVVTAFRYDSGAEGTRGFGDLTTGAANARAAELRDARR